MNIQLKPIKKSDNFSLLAIYGNPKVAIPAGTKPLNQLQLNQLMDSLVKEGTGVYGDDKLIGVITLEDLGEHTGNIGFLLQETYWNQGIMTNALNLYIDLLKQQNYHYLYANVFVENTKSIHLLEKLDFRFVQEFEAYLEELGQTKTLKLYINEL